ncbi:MAG: efflux RND transporter periplasmic adaptor subunit [Bacteroidales bacterium]|nr:efflux RND transporter periplasmic adaptor subunit [Bacteroidales bacterium]
MKKICLPVLAMIVLAGCTGKKNEQAPVQQAEQQLPVVKLEKAVKQLVSSEGVYSSTVLANVTNNIAPQAGGRIQKINVEVGDFVSKGQILAEMDRVQLDQAKLQLANAETELERIKKLYEQGGVSQSDYEAMELQCKVARTSYNNLLENTILRSPINGVVTARNYDRGDMFGMAAPIFTVQQIVPVKLLVGISEADYTKVKKGDKVSLTVDARPGKVYEGRITRLYPTIDPATHTFNVEIQVANQNRELRPGMYARVTVTFGQNNSVVVPDASIVKMQGSGQRSVFVFNAADSTVTEKVVTLGRHTDGLYQILDGVNEGEEVVVKGLASLRNGSKVSVLQ